MRLKQIGEFVENSKVTLFLRRALSSYFFPLVTAGVMLSCYYLGCEVAEIWYICLSGACILICCKDASPLICNLLFLNVLTSVGHSPSYLGANSDYLIRPANLAQEIIAVIILAVPLIYRTVDGLLKRRVRFSATFWSVMALCVAFMLGGIFSPQYTPKNLLFGFELSLAILGVYVFVCGNVELGQPAFKRIALYMVALCGVVAIELTVAYCTYEGLIVGGAVVREKLYMGWGTYNQMGMLLTLTVPSFFYLAGKFKYGAGFLIGGIANVVLCFLCMSRQAALVSTVIFVACCVWLFIADKGVKRIIDASAVAAIIIIITAVLLANGQEVKEFFSSLRQSLETGSGRTTLWRDALRNWLHKPLFGVGFYNPLAESGQVGYFGNGLGYSIPRMAHNTVFQIASACGTIGVCAYVIHRTQTVISYISNVNCERTFIALTLCALLGVSLLDNHLFYFLPTIVYAAFTALLAASENIKRADKEK